MCCLVRCFTRHCSGLDLTDAEPALRLMPDLGVTGKVAQGRPLVAQKLHAPDDRSTDTLGGSARSQSELPHQSNFIKSSPTLDNLVASDSEHLHAFKD